VLRVYAPVVLLATVATLASCSSSGSGAEKTPVATAPPGPHASTTGDAPTAAASTPAISRPPTAATAASGRSGSTCAESQLRATVSSADAAGLDRHVLRLVFTNTSSTVCTLTGYPGAAIVDFSGKQVHQAKRVVGGPVAGTIEKIGTVPVPPGAHVFAYLEGQSTRGQGAAQAGCDAPKYPRILVTPPNTRTAVPFTIGWPQCYTFDVHPVRQQ
jgi:Protein of unknown function (DUF4232)